MKVDIQYDLMNDGEFRAYAVASKEGDSRSAQATSKASFKDARSLVLKKIKSIPKDEKNVKV